LIPAPDIDVMRDELARAFEYRYPDDSSNRVRMVGILFAPPTAPLARDELVARLDEYHERSGSNIDLFWAGYGRYWGPFAPADERAVTSHDPPWLFSQTLFEEFRTEIESETKWRYSGEVDLLLLNARFDDTERAVELQLTDIPAFRLAQAKADGAIFSVASLPQDLFRYAETQSGTDPAWGFFGRESKRNIGEALVEVVLSLLRVDLRPLWKRGRHYSIC
jgi:hypothetical protein